MIIGKLLLYICKTNETQTSTMGRNCQFCAGARVSGMKISFPLPFHNQVIGRFWLPNANAMLGHSNSSDFHILDKNMLSDKKKC